MKNALLAIHTTIIQLLVIGLAGAVVSVTSGAPYSMESFLFVSVITTLYLMNSLRYDTL